MNIEIPPQKIGCFVLSQMGFLEKPGRRSPSPAGPAITISQQSGSGAHEIAQRVAELFNQDTRSESARWNVLDRELVETVLEELHLPKRLAKRMPEDRRTYLEDVADELLGLRPPSWVLVPQVVQTILQFIKTGHVIVVGRGATVFTAEMKRVFHVRLVASLPRRIERVQQLTNVSREQAAEMVSREDRGSQRYAKAHFHARIEDELLYHLIINTDRVPYREAALDIVDGARRCFERNHQAQQPGS